MNKKHKRLNIIFSIMLFLVLLLFPRKMYCASTGYTIKAYNVDIKVNEDNSFNIVETITADFHEKRHGIKRKLPIYNEVERTDGSTSKNYATITDISVSEPYSKSIDKKNKCKILQIGSASKNILGEHTYVIKYKYTLIGRDNLENADEFYFNIIGTQWDTEIENATFKITMPKEFDSSLLGFSSGSKGSDNSYNIQYSVAGNVITGSIKKPLEAYQGITIRLTLPDGYFFNIIEIIYKILNRIVGFIKTYYMKIVLIIGATYLFKTFIFWLKYGKDEKYIETVEFYPPYNLNPATLGYVYKGEATNEQVISILIQLANKGYIKIEEFNTNKLFNKKSFRIIKLKEYSEEDILEKEFFDGLFKGNDAIPYRILKDEEHAVVTEKELKKKFYITVDKIKKELEKNEDAISENNYKIQYEIRSMSKKLFFLSLCNIFIYYEAHIVYKIIAVLALQLCVSKIIKRLTKYHKIRIRNLISFVLLIAITVFFIMITIYPIILNNSEAKTFYILIVIIIGIMTMLNKLMPRRTHYGAEMLGKIKGFKNFLENAEKEQLETLVEENPEYFYDILPYTYALGVSKKWIERFETIAIVPPDWFESSNNKFNTNRLINEIDDTVKEVSYYMTYRDMEYETQKTRSSDYSYSSSSDYSYSDNSSSDDYSSNSGGGFSGGGSGGRRR